jgi:hypothetical protein
MLKSIETVGKTEEDAIMSALSVLAKSATSLR